MFARDIKQGRRGSVFASALAAVVTDNQAREVVIKWSWQSFGIRALLGRALLGLSGRLSVGRAFMLHVCRRRVVRDGGTIHSASSM